jgi:hypothetical protein
MKIAVTMFLLALGLSAADTVAVTKYRDQDLIPIKTKVRFTTLIVLPKGEEISEVSCGDTAYWVIDGKDNVLHVKPAREGAATNLNIVLKSKAIYSFLLEEIGSKGTPDLKVVVGEDEVLRLREEKAALERHAIEVEAAHKGEVTRLEAEGHRIEAEAKATVEQMEKDMPDRIAEFLSGLKFSYFCYDKTSVCLGAVFATEEKTYVVGHLGLSPYFVGRFGKASVSNALYQFHGDVYTIIGRADELTIWSGGKRVTVFLR